MIDVRSEKEVFRDLSTLCSSPGYVHVLAHISFRDNFISYDGEMTNEDMAASYAPERTIRTEFSTLMGLMLKQPLDFSLPAPQVLYDILERTQALLSELHACLNQPMFEGIKRTVAAHKAGIPVDQTASTFHRGDVLREPIFYGGESAYSFQYLEFALDRYAKDDDWLYANKGFRIADGYALARGLSRLQSRKIPETITSMRSLDPSSWTVLPGFTFSLDEISSESGISPEIASAVLAALSAPEPPSNLAFASLGDFNVVNALPIVRSASGDYISLQTYGVVEALYDSPFYWMAGDKSYKDIAFSHRGAFTEEFVAKRLRVAEGVIHHTRMNAGRNECRNPLHAAKRVGDA